MTTALQVQPNGKRDSSPLAIIPALLENGASVDDLAKIYELQAKHEDREAEKAFNAAMIVCQSEMPEVSRNQTNTQTNSKYADLQAVHKAIKPVYQRHGFSCSHGQGQSDKPDHYRWLLHVHHSGGHTRDYFIDLPSDDKGMKGGACKTLVQGVASSGTYAQRILECRAFDITIPWLDKDGNSPQGPKVITLDQVATINDWLIQKDVKLADFLGWAECESLDQLPASKYRNAIDMLRARPVGPKGAR